MRGIPRDELKIETSNASSFAEHFCLEMTRLVLGRLSASGVKREDQPPWLARLDRRIQRFGLAKDGLDLGA
jgi:hypothetical protein